MIFVVNFVWFTTDRNLTSIQLKLENVYGNLIFFVFIVLNENELFIIHSINYFLCVWIVICK